MLSISCTDVTPISLPFLNICVKKVIFFSLILAIY